MEDSYEQEIYEQIEAKCNEYEKIITKTNMTWKLVNQEDINIGDYIKVRYYPSSIKDLYTHTSEIGQVIFKELVLNPYNNLLENEIKILNYDNLETSIIKGYLCMYSSGYDMEIYKLSTNKRKLDIDNP